MANKKNDIKTSPGVVCMKCMIWEPTPMSFRKQQDEQFIYNAYTLSKNQNASEQFEFYQDQPYSIYLKPIHVPRDTFLRIQNEMLTPNREDMLDFKGKPLFRDGKPSSPWISHQTFRLVGSLFSKDVLSPSSINGNNDDAYKSGYSRWGYGWNNVAFATNGANGKNQEDDFDTKGTTDEKGTAIRKNKRIYPAQIEVSGIADKTAPSEPIHWLVEKEEPMFNHEDFFVEFIRQSYSFDMTATDRQVVDDYDFFNPNLMAIQDSATKLPIVVNGAVVTTSADGSVSKENIIDLSKQAYYLIEIGHGDPDHHYFILLAYNHYPVFIHTGKSPVLVRGGDKSVLVNPERDISYRISTYKVSCKELMDMTSLRINVRHHLGMIEILFNGDKSKPWIISRSDYDFAKWKSSSDLEVGDISSNGVYMRVPPRPIRIGAGNVLCGFTFGPMAYNNIAIMQIPEAIVVRGPVDDDKINCLLREKVSKTVNGRIQPVYFQEADVYVEIVDDEMEITSRDETLLEASEQVTVPGWTRNDKTTRSTVVVSDSELFIGSDGYLSFIRVYKNGKLREVPTSQDKKEKNDAENLYSTTMPADMNVASKYFTGEYRLGAGDVVVGKGTDKEWCIANCVTPIATGWRLFIPPTDDVIGVSPVLDVAHHVLSFNSQWQFSDHVKVEHSGSIKFMINFGEMTGFNDESPDHSEYLTGLIDKTFLVRIYTWWEGGYMDCKIDGCACKRNSINGGDKSVIFTGLAHGGQVTVESGKRVLECQLLDYWKILQDSQFLNSPFFDGMRDFNAVYEILRIAGFSDVGEKWAPAGWIKKMVDAPGGLIQTVIYGEPVWARDYALPSAFNILQSPLFRFADGNKLEEAIVKIAKVSAKMAMFDRYGVFRLQSRPDQYFCAPGHPAFAPRCNFFASPVDIPNDGCKEYDSISIGSYSYKRVVADVPNEILIVSTTPNGAALIDGGVNLPGKFDPNSTGYAGYTKRLMQMEGIFGSEEAVEKIQKYYSGFYIPPIMINWSSMGIPHLMAGDTVTFTGLRYDDTFPPPTRNSGEILPEKTTTVYITSLSTEIEPPNKWTNRYEGEWIYVGELDCNANTVKPSQPTPPSTQPTPPTTQPTP